MTSSTAQYHANRDGHTCQHFKGVLLNLIKPQDCYNMNVCISSVHRVLESVHSVRLTASVRVHREDPEQPGSGHLHPESRSPQLRGQPHHLLPLLHKNLSSSQVNKDQ